MHREARKGGVCLGKGEAKQHWEMEVTEQQSRGHGVGWLLKVWGQQGHKRAWPDLNLPTDSGNCN